MKQVGFYSVGEFALLCDTTKDTLHHYNRIGLLKPAGIAERGYRLYTLRDFFLFNMIRALRTNGCSLDEIHALLETEDANQYISSLEQHKQAFLQNKHDDQTVDMIEHCIRFMRCSITIPTGVPMVTFESEPVYLFATPCPVPVRPPMEDYKDLLFHHLVALSTIPSAIKYPLGGIVNMDSFLQGNYGLSYFTSHSTKELDGNHAKTLPAGKYLAYLYESKYNDLEKAYQILQDYITTHNLQVCGDLYEFGVLDDWSSTKQNRNLTYIRIPIR